MTLIIPAANFEPAPGILSRPARNVDEERFREMATEFRQQLLSRPFVNHLMMSMTVGIRAFGLSVDQVRQHDRSALAVVRQQLMAFSFVICAPHARKLAIGRLYNRRHTNVIFAVSKYGDTIREIVG